MHSSHNTPGSDIFIKAEKIIKQAGTNIFKGFAIYVVSYMLKN